MNKCNVYISFMFILVYLFMRICSSKKKNNIHFIPTLLFFFYDKYNVIQLCLNKL